jgi:hypothetical protein
MIESISLRMRRALASLLLAVFSFPLIAPAVFASAESNLPECCRRNGKHHCAMTKSDAASSTGVFFGSIAPRCPLYPGAPATPAGKYVAVLNGAGAVFAAFVSHPAIQIQVAAGYRLSFSRSSQKRGPPVVLS